MKSPRLAALLAVLWLLCRPAQLAGQQTETGSARLSAPHYQTHFRALDIPYHGFRVWDKNYLVVWAIDGGFDASPSKPAVVLYDRNGQIAREAIVWFKDAANTGVNDAAVTKSGTLIVSGGVTSPTGAIANYIAEIDDTGHMGRVVRTTPFLPVYICAADDGTVWSYGFDRDDKLEGVPGSLMLRQFSFNKGQLRAMLDKFRAHTPWWLTEGRYPGDISLRCTSQKVGLYNGAASEWVEFDIPTGELKVSKVTPLPSETEMRISGFAMTESGDVFVSLRERSVEHPRSGLFKLRFDHSGVGEWVPVKGTVGPYVNGAPVGELLGTDGTGLIYKRDMDGIAYWSTFIK